MEVNIVDTFDELSRKASSIIMREIEKNKKLLLCAATGGSPTQTYQLISDEFEKQPQLFSHLRIIKLDEWGGIPMNHPSTCESYMQHHLIEKLQIPGNRYFSFNSDPSNPDLECERMQELLTKEGPIDLCILGLGINGHLALNEPSDFLQPNCHIAELSSESLKHSMISELETKPAYGLTLGMADILKSKMILVLVNGASKKSIVSRFLQKKITSSLPASFLWLHPNAICLVSKDAME